MNEYGSKEGIFAALDRSFSLNGSKDVNNENSNSNSNAFVREKPKEIKKPVTQNNITSSSLNRLFTIKPSELKNPSPNKMFIFKYRNKK